MFRIGDFVARARAAYLVASSSLTRPVQVEIALSISSPQFQLLILETKQLKHAPLPNGPSFKRLLTHSFAGVLSRLSDGNRPRRLEVRRVRLRRSLLSERAKVDQLPERHVSSHGGFLTFAEGERSG